MLDLNEFAKAVHENAVNHGFWEDSTDERQIALIHSEWSEALQADRSGCTPREVCTELIDGVLRVLDYCAANEPESRLQEYDNEVRNFFELIVCLHYMTSKIEGSPDLQTIANEIISYVFTFSREYGFDPYELMKQKHEFNLTRPPKHGKRY
jgi:hypothetical protein